MDLIKYDMTDIWASAGDVVAPDSAKINAGWGVEVVPRQWWNWFENRQDQNIAYLLQKGFPEWDATTEYISNKSYVQRSGVVYKAIATNTNSDPIALTSWVRAFQDYTIASNALGSVSPTSGAIPFFSSGTSAATFQSTAFTRAMMNSGTDAAGVRTYLSAQGLNVNLTALSGVVAAVNILPYFNSTTTMAATTLTAFGRSLIAAADSAASRAIIDTYSKAEIDAADSQRQPLDATLTTLAAMSTTANTIPYFTATDVAATTSLTAFARSALALADADSTRTYLGLGTISTQSASNVNITGGVISGITDLAVSDGGTGASTAAAARANLGADSATNLTTGTLPVGRLSGTYSIDVSGNSGTATALQTPRSINGVLFDGTSNITVADSTKLPLAGGTLTGALTINQQGEGLTLKATSSGVAATCLAAFKDSSGVRYGYVGKGDTTTSDISLVADTGNINIRQGVVDRLVVTSTGVSVTGALTSTSFSGDGASITNLNASNLLTGTVPVASGGTGATTVTGTGNNVLSASPTLSGVPTAPTAASGTNTTQIATTAFVQAATGGASPDTTATAWVSFNGSGTVAIRDSYNISSVTDTGVGTYTINFSSYLTDSNYAAVGNCSLTGNATMVTIVSQSASSVSIRTSYLTSTTPGGAVDPAIVNLIVFGGR